MTIGLGGGGAVGVAFETTMGTYVAPTVWVPVLSEGLAYNEAKYYSPQIRQQTIVSDVQQGYYHVEGDLVMEVDPNFLPYFMYASRHNITKTGASAPYTYAFTPGSFASAGTAASGAVPRTMSITIIRNGIVFGYSGCVVGQYAFTETGGVDQVTLTVLGLSEATQTLPTPTWVAPDLFGAATHAVYIDTAGLTPTFATPDVNHNGFTFTSNFNASAQNRIVRSRAATYIAFGETDAQYDTELDFTARSEYDNYVNSTLRAFRYESIHGASWATATDGWRVTCFRSVYDTYGIALGAMGDIIFATGVVGRAIGIAGGDAYKIEVLSAANIS
jgi:hypothetical protein